MLHYISSLRTHLSRALKTSEYRSKHLNNAKRSGTECKKEKSVGKFYPLLQHQVQQVLVYLIMLGALSALRRSLSSFFTSVPITQRHACRGFVKLFAFGSLCARIVLPLNFSLALRG